jgi:putative aldouronate transport system permease protein
MLGDLYLWPRVFSTTAYRVVWTTNNIGQASLVSLSRTILGTAIMVFFTSMLAFVLSRPYLIWRKFFNRLFVITMYVSAGLIPWYLTLKTYGFINNFLVYIIPGMIGVFNMILFRVYMEGLPVELSESAEIDGANDFTVFLRIVLPICTPVLAVVCVFGAVGQWNSWFDAAVFNNANKDLQPLQLILMNMLKRAAIRSSSDVQMNNSASLSLTPESMRASVTIIATAPIICVYPFFQRYFAQGIMLGSVKG